MLTLFKPKNEHRGVKLLGKKNRSFLKGKHGELDRRKEVYRNLDRRLWLKTPNYYRSRNKIMIGVALFFAALWFLGGALMFVFGGITLAQRLADLKWALYLDDTGAVLLVIIGGLYLMAFAGYPYGLQAYLMITHLMYATELYNELKEKGQVVYGDVIEIKQAISDRLETQISYQFRLPDTETTVEADYFTVVLIQEFQKGDKIAVLYLNHRIHVLL